MCCCYSIIYIFSRKIFLILCLFASDCVFSSAFYRFFCCCCCSSSSSEQFLYMIFLLFSYYFYIFYFFLFNTSSCCVFCALPCLPLPKCFFFVSSSSIAVGMCCVYSVCLGPFHFTNNPTTKPTTKYTLFIYILVLVENVSVFYSVILFWQI